MNRPTAGATPASSVPAGPARKLAQLFVGLTAAALVFGAVPTVLVLLAGVPIPRQAGHLELGSLHALFDGLALVAWIAWGACCWPVLRSVVLRVRRRDVSFTPGGRWGDRLSARIAIAVLTVLPLGAAGAALAAGAAAPPAITNPAPASPPVRGPTPAPLGPVRTEPPTTPSGSAPGVQAADPAPMSYTVRPGDTLWSIAERLYGDGGDWPAIAATNYGRPMAEGRWFVDPNMIDPGWTLALPQEPADRRPPGVASSGGPGVASSPGPGPGVASSPGPGPGVASSGGPAPSPTVAVRSAAPPAGPIRTGRGDAAVAERSTGLTGRGTPVPPLGSSGSGGGTGRPPAPPLPELVALGMGVIIASATCRRMRDRRRLRDAGAHAGRPATTPSEEATDIGTLLERFAEPPVLDLLERANRHLTAVLDPDVAPGPPPGIRVLRVGPSGVDAWLDGEVTWAPEGWDLLPGGRTWRLAPDRSLTAPGGSPAWLPVLLPVGEDATGSWLVAGEPGSRLPVLGAGGPALVAAMRLAISVWPWSEQVTTTDDPAAAERCARANGAHGGADRLRTLYVGDPGRLGPAARAHCSTLSAQPVAASDLTIVVDDRAATIHPLGLALRPHRLDEERPQRIGELLDPSPAPAPPPSTGSVSGSVSGSGSGSGSGSVSGSGSGSGSGADTDIATPPLDRLAPALEPGAVEVRLLTGVPRIDGVPGPLPANRTRRAVELVAYLALHRPQPVTGDRLRTRVLGSADADAAAKTLFNTAAAARRALGDDTTGHPVLPPAGRYGYQISAELTVDVQRAEALVAAARVSADRQLAMALHRAALSLVEGEPLSAILSGYGWWLIEGHAARISAVLVEAACTLAAMATEEGRPELAQWAVGQARHIEPYHEGLARAAMRAAAAIDDADGVRREWHECQRWVDELAPGASPSARTESVYAELTRRLPQGTGAAGTPSL